ncbi:MAG TPA: LysE family translocator [Rhodococcus sp. (in: high G+C Gram-positive bacteria)]|nr:LysE family translocator [Rhodococcus sp. (in: high G+C Gram-positive bacteria)]
MAAGVVAAFWMVSILFVLTPGADWAYAITAGLRYRSVVPAVSGMLLGHLAMTAVVAAGVAAVLAQSPVLLAGLSTVGAAYLMWLGMGMLTSPSAPQEGGPGGTHSWARQTVKGVGVSGLNPKVFLLLLALLPQFTDPAAPWPLAAQIVMLGVVHVITCAVVYLGVGAGAKRVLRARPKAAEIVSRVSGAVMIALGAVLVIDQVLL